MNSPIAFSPSVLAFAKEIEGPSYLNQLNSYNIVSNRNSLYRTHKLWIAALVITAVAFIALAVASSLYALVSLSTISFMIAFTTMIAGLPLSAKVLMKCYEKAQDCLHQKNYISLVERKLKLIPTEQEALKQLCISLEIDPTLFTNHQQALRYLLAEYQMREENLAETEKRITLLEKDFKEAPHISLKEPRIPFKTRLEKFSNLEVLDIEIGNSKEWLAIKKLKTANLLNFLRNPGQNLMNFHFIHLTDSQRKILIEKKDPTADAVVLIESTRPAANAYSIALDALLTKSISDLAKDLGKYTWDFLKQEKEQNKD